MSGSGPGARAGLDALRQWQMLQLSKVELDLQQSALNALQQSADEANATSSLYRQVFELSPACCLALDSDGRIVCANQAGAGLLGQPAGALAGQPFERYLAPDEQPRWRAFGAALAAGPARAGMDTQLFSGIPGAGAVRLEARRDAASGLSCLVLVPQADPVQRAEAGRAAPFADEVAPEVARQVAAYVAEQAGARLPERISDDMQARIAAQIGAQVAAQLAERTAVLERANTLLQQQLAERNEERFALCDAAAQLQLLGEQQAIENEDTRLRLARTVHDELGQNLLALRIDVSMLEGRTGPRQPRLHARAGAALQTVDLTLRSVRGVINQLRPAVLDLGLQAAVDWLLAEFRSHSGIACTLDAPDDEVFVRIAPNAGLMLFRQLQAALASLQRESGASAVVVSLRLHEGSVLLVLTDDGAGSAGATGGRRQRQALAHLAIAGRLRAHGGTLEVSYGEAGQGCRMCMRIPAVRN